MSLTKQDLDQISDEEILLILSAEMLRFSKHSKEEVYDFIKELSVLDVSKDVKEYLMKLYINLEIKENN